MTDQELNDDQIDRLWAKRDIVKELGTMEINTQVARKLGWFQCSKQLWHLEHLVPEPRIMLSIECQQRDRAHLIIPDYCHSIAAAWEIVEKQKEAGYFRIYFDREFMGHGQRLGYVCVFGVPNSPRFVEEWASTAPMAICLAFLKLTGGAC